MKRTIGQRSPPSSPPPSSGRRSPRSSSPSGRRSPRSSRSIPTSPLQSSKRQRLQSAPRRTASPEDEDLIGAFSRITTTAPSAEQRSRSPGSESREYLRRETLNRALYDAVLSKDLPLVQALLDQEADPNTIERGTRVTPLMYASSIGNFPIVRELIERGASVNKRDITGKTALSFAIGSPRIVNYLIEQGADPDIQDRSRMTPLMYASIRGSLPVVQYLIEAGSDPAKRDIRGSTALDHAVYNNKPSVANYLRSLE